MMNYVIERNTQRTTDLWTGRKPQAQFDTKENIVIGIRKQSVHDCDINPQYPCSTGKI